MKAIVSFIVCALTLCAQPPTNEIVWMNATNCPLKILGGGPLVLNAGGTDLLGTVILGNTSSKTIIRIQMAWIIRDLAKEQTGVIQFATPRKLEIDPGAVLRIRAVGAKMTEVEAHFKALEAQKPTLQVGIVNISFADGTEWKFDLGEQMRFLGDETLEDASRTFKEALSNMSGAVEEKRSPGDGLLAKVSAKCQTPQEAMLAFTAGAGQRNAGGCGSSNPPNPVVVCNPGNKSCTELFFPDFPSGVGCSSGTCIGYGCQLRCCILNVCTGGLNCY